jgi:hypothetical protein
MMRCAGHRANVKKNRRAYRILVRQPESKEPNERCRRNWEDNIQIDLKEAG